MQTIAAITNAIRISPSSALAVVSSKRLHAKLKLLLGLLLISDLSKAQDVRLSKSDASQMLELLLRIDVVLFSSVAIPVTPPVSLLLVIEVELDLFTSKFKFKFNSKYR